MSICKQGFTLIELVIAIVVMTIGASAFLTLVFNITRHSADPMIQQQAYAITQAYMEEILARPFCDPDDATCQAGCSSATACSSCNAVEATRDLYDAVCDYDGLADNSGAEDFGGTAISGLEAYNVNVTVDDSAVTLGGLSSGTGQVVQIEVNVTHDGMTDIDVTLQAFKTNF